MSAELYTALRLHHDWGSGNTRDWLCLGQRLSLGIGYHYLRYRVGGNEFDRTVYERYHLLVSLIFLAIWHRWKFRLLGSFLVFLRHQLDLIRVVDKAVIKGVLDLSWLTCSKLFWVYSMICGATLLSSKLDSLGPHFCRN